MRYLFTTATLAALAAPTLAAQSVEVRRADGLRTVEFATRHGAVRVNLPDDIRPGDMISGSVVVAPRGDTEKNRSKNAGILNGYVIELRDERGNTIGRAERAVLPAGLAVLTLVLLDGKGRDIASTGVESLAGQQTPLPPNLPQFAQPGQPLTIPGSFDGNAANTTVRAQATGDAEPAALEVLAESPRSVVIANPAERVGAVSYEIRENGVATRGTYHSIGISLSAPRLQLTRGERIQVAVTVSGLEGYPLADRPLAVQVTNQSPSVISIGGTNRILLPISRQEAGDRVEVGRVDVQSTQAGSFTIGAGIIASFAPPAPPGAGVADSVPVDMSGLTAKDLRDERNISEGRLKATLCDLRLRLAYSDAQGGTSSAWLKERIGWVEAVFVRRGMPGRGC